MCLMPTLASGVLKLKEAPQSSPPNEHLWLNDNRKCQLRFNIFLHLALNLPTFHSFSSLDESHESDAIEWWYNKLALTTNNLVELFRHWFTQGLICFHKKTSLSWFGWIYNNILVSSSPNSCSNLLSTTSPTSITPNQRRHGFVFKSLY